MRLTLRLPLLVALLCAGLWLASSAEATTVGGLRYAAASQAPAPAPAPAPTPGTTGGTDPSAPIPPPADPGTVIPAPKRGQVARLLPNGLAVAPAGAPAVVRLMIDAANRIARTPYVWGGGHQRWDDAGYDCSGSVSYVLHAAGLLEDSLVSGDFVDWGLRGRGAWVAIFANEGHMYMSIAGLRFDTSGQKQSGSRWQRLRARNGGVSVRHPAGL
ncbi:unannotated protein [freshwater metagenome]|uniref:Unannotated protein n=1 Tax=freshwater metagenome TaxID=449393 RepID=A0A6J7IVI9_9ZZZZ|nr:hypothetical protein [Actinomycetota bacterium]